MEIINIETETFEAQTDYCYTEADGATHSLDGKSRPNRIGLHDLCQGYRSFVVTVATEEMIYELQFSDKFDDSNGFYPYLCTMEYIQTGERLEFPELITLEKNDFPEEWLKNKEDIGFYGQQAAHKAAARLVGKIMVNEAARAGIIRDEERQQAYDSILIHDYDYYVDGSAIIINTACLKRGVQYYRDCITELSDEEIDKIIAAHEKAKV